MTSSRDIALDMFDRYIVPLAASAPGLKLDWRPGLRDGSYFRPAWPPAMLAEDPAKSAADNLIAELEALWGRDAPELLALLPDIAKLAEAVAEEQTDGEEGPDAPSQLIYQMW